jgi:hypothetical protein
MEEMINAHKNLVGKSEGKRPMGDLGVDGKAVSKWVIKKEVMMLRIGLICLRMGISSRLLRIW